MRRIVSKVSGRIVDGARSAIDPRVDLRSGASMLDLRAAVIEHVEQSVTASGRGMRVLPGPVVIVQVYAGGFKDARALGPVMDDVRSVLIERLDAMKCIVPDNFQIHIKTVSRRLTGWDPSQQFAVAFQKGKSKRVLGTDILEPRGLRLVVARGSAQRRVFDLLSSVIRIGRTQFPADARGHVRTNDIAFDDDGSEQNRSVGRGHAEIRFMPGTGTYRVFDQGSANGTRVLRKGRLSEVAPRDPVGFQLQPGDEVHVGRAAIRFVKYLN